MMLGAICAIALQAAFVAWRLDVTALFEFVRGVPQMLAQTEILEAKPWAGHSLRTLTRLLPGWVGTPLWVLLAGLCIAAAIRTWRPSIPLRVRLGVIVLVSVLASPHLLVYDATILVLPLLWFAEWMETRARYTVRYRVLAHALIVAFALPVARVIDLQPSVVVMCWMCAVVAAQRGRRTLTRLLGCSEGGHLLANGLDALRCRNSSLGGSPGGRRSGGFPGRRHVETRAAVRARLPVLQHLAIAGRTAGRQAARTGRTRQVVRFGHRAARRALVLGCRDRLRRSR